MGQSEESEEWFLSFQARGTQILIMSRLFLTNFSFDLLFIPPVRISARLYWLHPDWFHTIPGCFLNSFFCTGFLTFTFRLCLLFFKCSVVIGYFFWLHTVIYNPGCDDCCQTDSGYDQFSFFPVFCSVVVCMFTVCVVSGCICSLSLILSSLCFTVSCFQLFLTPMI